MGGAADPLVGGLDTFAFEAIVEIVPLRNAPARDGVAFGCKLAFGRTEAKLFCTIIRDIKLVPPLKNGRALSV